MLFEDLIAKREREDFLQFIEHDLRIIVRVDIVVFLPRLQFLHKCAGLVFSVDDGFLEGLDDGGDFMLLMGFLGEDDRIGDLRNTLLGGSRSGGDVFGLAGTDDGGEVFASCVDIELGGVVVVNDFGVDESRFTHTIGTKKAQIRETTDRFGKTSKEAPLIHAKTRI